MGLPLRHRAAAFLASFLVFHLELSIAKELLPHYGGSASVWTTSVMVFQGLVFFAALYAMALRSLSRSRRPKLHVALIAAAALAPLSPSVLAWPSSPEARLTAELLLAIGAPFLLLSSTTSVLDDWLDRPQAGPLYGASNAGALAALAAFPLAFEPWFSLGTQRLCWRAAYAAFGCLLLASRPPRSIAAEPSRAPGSLRLEPAWLLAAAAPSAALLAATHALTLDLAAGPLLWAVPLAVYLGSLAVSFKREPWEPKRLAVLLAAGALAWLVLFAGAGAWSLVGGGGGKAPRAVLSAGMLALDLGALALLSLACHLALARAKPAGPEHAARFYAAVAAGGWAGSLLVAVLLPLVARDSAMLTLDWLLAAALGLGAAMLSAGPSRIWILAGSFAAACAFISGATLWSLPASARRLEGIRNFYGISTVVERSGMRELYHGNTRHGMQFLDPERRRKPASYHDERGPLGDAFRAWSPSLKRVAVLGLGVGAVAAYATPGQHWDFYELDPDVVSLAKERFTYLQDCRASWQVHTGDARLVLKGTLGASYDLLMVDAFHSDAMPVHLATREAVSLYLERLAPGGVLLFHVSSRFLDLRPMLAGMATATGLAGRTRRAEAPADGTYDPSTWVVLAREPSRLTSLEAAGWTDLAGVAAQTPWEDDHASLLPAASAAFRAR